MVRAVGRALIGLAILGLPACSIHYQDLSQPSSEQSQIAFYHRPAIGTYLCLSIVPGTPVTRLPGGGGLVGYTRDVVAFAGEQNGQYIEIRYYDGALGWVDGLKISPYHGSHPGASCVIPGVDVYLRPHFVIR